MAVRYGMAGEGRAADESGCADGSERMCAAEARCAGGAGRVTEADVAFMRRALALASRGVGRTNPNPLVGAVVVRDGRIIGEGWHACYGEAHAERNALADCAARGEDPRGATVYVTLEPCSHHGKQPPCADALVEAGVARVMVGSRDPNPLVSGRGLARLAEAGIEVAAGVLCDECDAINQVFFHYIMPKAPYVVAKWAMTADGRIACSSGDARWVSGPASRRDCHALRHRLAAVMVGAGTVAADDPLLTCRLAGGRNPLRVVCDTRLSIAEDCALVRSAESGEAPLLVACGPIDGAAETAAEPAAGFPPKYAEPFEQAARAAKAARLRACGVEVIEVPLARTAASGANATSAPNPPASVPEPRIDLRELMAALGSRGIDSVLLEGGSRLHGSAFAAGIVNEAVAYVAPKAVCDAAAPGPVAGAGVPLMADALRFGAPHVNVLGSDVRIAWRVGATEGERALPCVACGPLYPGGATTAQIASAVSTGRDGE